MIIIRWFNSDDRFHFLFRRSLCSDRKLLSGRHIAIFAESALTSGRIRRLKKEVISVKFELDYFSVCVASKIVHSATEGPFYTNSVLATTNYFYHYFY